MAKPWQSGWRPLLSGLGLAAFLVTVWLGRAGIFFLAIVFLAVIVLERLLGFSLRSGLAPYPLLLFSPLTLIFFSSVNDFHIRLFCLLFLAYLASLASIGPGPPGDRWGRMSLPGHRRLPAVVWTATALLFALTAGWLANRGIYFSGDEPHYLMIAQSLAEDGDFNLKNNIAERTYLRFHPRELAAHVKAYGQRQVSFHMPGLAILLVPFYWIYGWLGHALPPQLFFRLAMALLNFFFVLGLFSVLKKQFPGFDSVRLGLLLTLTFPLLLQSVHLYPELPAAALMIGAYLFAGVGKKRYLVSGLLLALIPWFHLKYSLAVVVLAFFIIRRLLREKKWADLSRFLVLPALSAGLLLFYSRILYGSFNPNQIPQPLDFGSISLLNVVETFFSFFLDQRDGILLYSPFLLFAFWGLRKKWRPEGDHFRVLGWVFWSYLFFHAASLNRPGYSPAGRSLMFVFWIMAVFVAAFLYHNRDERWQFAFRLSAGWTILATCWLLVYPLFMYQPVDSSVSQRGASLAFFLGSEWIHLPDFLPSFLRTSNLKHPANYGWIILLLVAIFFYYRRQGDGPRKFKNRNAAGAVLFIFLAILLCFFPHVYLRQSYPAAGGKIRFFNNSGNVVYFPQQNLFQFKAGQRYDLFFDLNSSRRDEITLRLVNTDRVRVVVRNGPRILFTSDPAKENRLALRLSALRSLPVKNLIVAPVSLETKAAGRDVFFFLSLE